MTLKWITYIFIIKCIQMNKNYKLIKINPFKKTERQYSDLRDVIIFNAIYINK